MLERPQDVLRTSLLPNMWYVMISETSSTSIRAPARLVSSCTKKQRSYPRPNDIFGGGISGLQVLCQPICFVAQVSRSGWISHFCVNTVSWLQALCALLQALLGDKSKSKSENRGSAEEEEEGEGQEREREEEKEGSKKVNCWLTNRKQCTPVWWEGVFLTSPPFHYTIHLIWSWDCLRLCSDVDRVAQHSEQGCTQQVDSTWVVGKESCLSSKALLY